MWTLAFGHNGLAEFERELIRARSSAEGRWVEAYRASELGCLAGCRCSGCCADSCRNVSSVGQPETMTRALRRVHWSKEVSSLGFAFSMGAAHSIRASAQVTAPGAITSMIVAVSTRPNRQNRSTCSRMSVNSSSREFGLRMHCSILSGSP
jgi:hypothetical protein